jgi:hypothetical protein
MGPLFSLKRYLLRALMFLSMGVGYVLPLNACQLPENVPVWGVDFQVVQTRASLFQVQLTLFLEVPTPDQEATATVYVKEREVQVGPSPLVLNATASDLIDLPTDVSCPGMPAQVMRMVYTGEWKRPDYGAFDLYWVGGTPIQPFANVARNTEFSLTLSLEAVNATAPGFVATSFASVPGPVLCAKGLPAKGFTWGTEPGYAAQCRWEPLYGATAIQPTMPQDNLGFHPVAEADRLRFKPLFEPLQNTLKLSTPATALLPKGGAEDWVQIDFLPTTQGLYVLSAAADLFLNGQAVGQAKRLWMTAQL